MSKKEAIVQFGKLVVDKACKLLPKDVYLFDEDCYYFDDFPLEEKLQLEYLYKVKRELENGMESL